MHLTFPSYQVENKISFSCLISITPKRVFLRRAFHTIPKVIDALSFNLQYMLLVLFDVLFLPWTSQSPPCHVHKRKTLLRSLNPVGVIVNMLSSRASFMILHFLNASALPPLWSCRCSIYANSPQTKIQWTMSVR